MFLKRLGALMVKTHISTFSNPYLNQKRYGFQEVEIWVAAEWIETSGHKQTATSNEMTVCSYVVFLLFVAPTTQLIFGYRVRFY